MMRIAIAGSGGLAQMFAKYLAETEHITFVLSRTAQPPNFTDIDVQVIAVNYSSQSDLEYYLRGVDIVISTVSGAAQINLIDAAAKSRVSRFVPAEFEGSLSHRPRHDPLNRGKKESLARLKEWSHDARRRMKFTVFSCGVLYERFARGGLGAFDIGGGSGIQAQGAYIMDLGTATAETVEFTASGQPVYICLTSVHDLSRYIIAALDLGPENWPCEFKVQGDRRTVSEILSWGAAVRGIEALDTIYHNAENLQPLVDYYKATQDWDKLARFEELVATVKGRYDFSATDRLSSVIPMSFWNWLTAEWGS